MPRLTPQDIRVIAGLHVQCLPESLVSLVGESYGRHFYSYLTTSPLEALFVERRDGRVGAVAVLSYAPNTLSRRLLCATPLAFYLPFALHRLPLRSLLGGEPPPEDNAPELAIILTDPALRGAGLGRRLVNQVETRLRTDSANRYKVKTLANAENPALAFYASLGFSRCDNRTFHGTCFAVFKKFIAPSGS